MNVNIKKLAIPAMCLGLLGVAGGAAASQAFKPAEQPKPAVQLVQPAAQTVTVAPTPAATATATATTTAPKPAPAPVKKAAPVESTQAPSSEPTPVQEVVVPKASEPAPSATQPAEAPNPAPSLSPVKPPGGGGKLDPNAPPVPPTPSN